MPADKLGQEIAVGDYIVYGHALGRSAGLRLGKVLNITEHDRQWYYQYEGEPTKDHHFTIIGVDGEWSHQEPKLLSKKSTLMFNDRIVVLSPDKVPEKVRNLLDSFKEKK